MIKRVISVLLCLLFYSKGFSQRTVYTDIQKNDRSYPGKSYLFDKVIDARLNKDNIGTVYKSDIGQEHYADLNDPLATALMKFLLATFPKSSPQTKITININTFEIGHILTGRKKDTGFVKINLDFYKQSGDTSFLIYNYTNKLVDVNDNIALTHANRMKRIILMAVGKVDSVVLNGAKPYIKPVVILKNDVDTTDRTKQNSMGILKKYTHRELDSIANLRSGETNSNVATANQKFEDANYPRSVLILLGGQASFCSTAYMYGANINILGRIKHLPRMLAGINFNYSIIKFPDDVILPSNTAYKLRTSDVGLRLLYQIKNVVFFNFNPHLLIGKETYTTYLPGTVTASSGGKTTTYLNTDTKENTLIGSEFDTGIYLLHPKRSGAYLGFDLMLRFTNSSVFESDIGIKFNLGIAF